MSTHGDGILLKRTNTATSTFPFSTTTLYIGGIFEQRSSSVTGMTGKTKYYTALGRTIAVRQTPVGGTATLSYLLADHLGSTVGALDAAGNSLGTQAYWPFGAARTQTGGVATDKLYTSQQREALAPPAQASWQGQGATDALGTYFYKARFYSTTTGRFASADSIAVDGLNRYSYVGNNPVNYTDPSGLCAGVFEATGCAQEDQENILACALAGQCSDAAPHDDMVALSIWFLGQQSFWDHVVKTVDDNSILLANTTRRIMKLDADTFAALPTALFTFLGGAFGLSAAFFKASIADLMFGTHNVMALTEQGDIVGAYPWWTALATLVPIWGAQINADDLDGHFSSLTDELSWRTLMFTADAMTVNKGRIDGGEMWPWSDYQRTLLSDWGFPVRPALVANWTEALLERMWERWAELSKGGWAPRWGTP